MNNSVSELLEALEPFEPGHSGLCIDFSVTGWPVTEESCRCSEQAKRLRRAISSLQNAVVSNTGAKTNT